MSLKRLVILLAWGLLGVVLILLLSSPSPPAVAAPACKPLSAPGEVITVCLSSGCDYTSIQDAVDAANEGDTIKVAQGVYTSTAFQVVYINKAITIAGGYTTTDWLNSHVLTQPTVIDAENVVRRRGVYIDGTDVATITLRGLTIQRGHARGEGGGGIYTSNGTVILQDSQILSSTVVSGRSGGGLYMIRGSLMLSDTIIQGNSASNGAGAYIRDVDATLTGNTFLSNTVPQSIEMVLAPEDTPSGIGGGFYGGSGGGLYISGRAGSAELVNNVFQGNSAEGAGGGVYREGTYWAETPCIITLTHNVFQGNSAGSIGGAIHLDIYGSLRGNVFERNSAFHGGAVGLTHWVGWGGETCLSGNTILGNEAQGSGGGVYIEGETVVTMNVIQGNRAQDSGGGVSVAYGSVTMSGNTVLSNTVAGYGGGIGLGGFYELDRSGISTETIETGGGMDTVHVLDGNTILGNRADLGGGAIAMSSGIVDARNDILANNTSPWEGVYVAGGMLTARHWTLANNGSYALVADGGSATLSNTIVVSHAIAGFWGNNIVADHTLFHSVGITCRGGASCVHNLSGDPKFVDPSADDYHIGPGSAALDRGVNAGITRDIDDQPRPYQAPDLGADEYWPPDVLKYYYLPLIFRGG